MNKYSSLFLSLFFALSFAFLTSCNQGKAKTYGDSFEIDNPISIDELISQMEGKDELETQVTGEITQVCKHVGCWITFTTDSGEKIYINAIDESFSMPKDVVGKTATAKGTALSIEKQVELALAEGEEIDDLDWIDNISFEATGIIIE